MRSYIRLSKRKRGSLLRATVICARSATIAAVRRWTVQATPSGRSNRNIKMPTKIPAKSPSDTFRKSAILGNERSLPRVRSAVVLSNSGSTAGPKRGRAMIIPSGR